MPKLSCATLSADGFFAVSFDRTFEMLPAAGFRWVEFNLWTPECMRPAHVTLLRERSERAGLRVSSVHGMSVTGRTEASVETAYVIHLMSVAETLGCSRICFSGGKRGEDAALQGIIKVLAAVAPLAEDRGITICLENHAHNTLETIDDYQAICDAIPSPSVGICIDTGHFDASGVDTDALIDRLGDRVVHLHLKENHGVGHVDFRRFGEGTTDNGHVVERMMQRGYDGFMVCELSPQKDRQSTVDDLRTAHDMFRHFEQTPALQGGAQ